MLRLDTDSLELREDYVDTAYEDVRKYVGVHDGKSVSLVLLLDIGRFESAHARKDAVAEVVAEVRRLALAVHPNVVQLIGFDPQLQFVVMEHWDITLYSCVFRKEELPASPEQIVFDIASGLSHIHAHDIHVSDEPSMLNPDNVCCCFSGRSAVFKLRLFEEDRLSYAFWRFDNSCRVRPAPIVYMAPEFLRNRVTGSGAVDVWALGMVLLAVLTLRRPFEDMDLIQVATRVAYNNLKPTAPPGTLPVLADLLASTTQTDPGARPTAAQIVATLEAQCDLRTAHLGSIRVRATEICIALQDLGLPALVTLKIINAALPNAIRMAAKWDLIVAVKHFHDRRAAASSSTAASASSPASATSSSRLGRLKRRVRKKKE
jgi:serine/threonine protein kinase